MPYVEPYFSKPSSLGLLAPRHPNKRTPKLKGMTGQNIQRRFLNHQLFKQVGEILMDPHSLKGAIL